MFRSSFATGLAAVALIACGDAAAPDAPVDEAIPSFESDLVAPTPGGKTDTGYLSDLAAELEATFESQLRVDVSHLDEERQAAYRDRLLEESGFASQVTNKQIKFAKNQINTDALHLNLSASEVEVQSADLLEDGFIEVRYKASVETIVSHDELAEAGLTLEQLKAETFSAVLPDLPEAMAEKVGTSCLLEEESEAHAYNYFYYFAPDREGCPEAMETAGIRRAGARLEIHDLAPSKTVYPEYDQLVADGRIDVVAFFGAAEHDWEPGKWDWGTYGRDNFRRAVQGWGFRSEETEDGELYVRTAAGLEERIRIIGPETLKSLQDDADGLFKRMVRENEIVFYNGHSFYGSLDVLDEADLFPGRYQVFLMNSCWSYEYYTKQIFRANQTESDPQGWLLADVVNDTESGWFHNMADESRILLANLLAGAESGGVDGDRYYTWDRIIGAMNAHAVGAMERRNTETHEIYGVSGVTTNAYQPVE